MVRRGVALVSATISLWLAAVGSVAAQQGYRIIAVGDVMMGSSHPSAASLDPRLVRGADLAAIIGAPLLRILRSGDMVVANYEGAIWDGNGPTKNCRNPRVCFAFKSPDFHADILRDLGFNFVGLANNHTGDFQELGRVATIAALKRRGIAVAGIDQSDAQWSSLALKDGTRVAFVAFGFNPGLLSVNDIPRAEEIVRELRRGHDLVVVNMHAGGEGANYLHVTRQQENFLGENRGNAYLFAHRMIDAGAAVILGASPHVPRAVEVYKGRFIAYSLGNFWTYAQFNLKGPNGIAPVLDLVIGKDGRVLSAMLHSIKQDHPGLPRLDPDVAALRLVADLTAKDFPEAGLRFGADGSITGPGIGGRQ